MIKNILIVFLVLLLLSLLYIILIYKYLNKLNKEIDDCFSSLDVYFKKRWELVPDLVRIVKSYTKDESDVLLHIARLRDNKYSNFNLEDKFLKNKEIKSDIMKLISVGDKYKDLASNREFVELVKSFKEIDYIINKYITQYNELVLKFNKSISKFPSKLVGKIRKDNIKFQYIEKSF